MKDTPRKLMKKRDKTDSNIFRTILMVLLVFGYFYFLLIWTPSTYVVLLTGGKIFKIFKLVIVVGLIIYTSIQTEKNVFRAPRYSIKQIKDYEMWNKFFLHFAFMKTGSGSEKSQVLEVLRYLEDSKLKQTLTDVYEHTTTLKDAHNQIIEKYPYPQVKTFFSEAEDALVRGADGNHLMQKTSINIDKYINSITDYEKSKMNSYKVTKLLLVITTLLTLFMKIVFAEVFIDFTNSYLGLLILVVYFICLIKLLATSKKKLNQPLVSFGGEGDE